MNKREIYAEANRFIADTIDMDIDMRDYNISEKVVDAIYQTTENLRKYADQLDSEQIMLDAMHEKYRNSIYKLKIPEVK